MQIQTGIITISDRASKGLYDDLGGPALKKAAEGYGWKILTDTLVPDEKREIQRAIREQISNGAHLILTTGGTGVALRDVTPEAVREIAKGNVLATARLAGIMAAKKTGDLIPLCQPLGISHCEINFEFAVDRIVITATTRIAAQSGVEMEALTAVSIAALTIYDMCKAIDKSMRIDAIHLVSKTKK